MKKIIILLVLFLCSCGASTTGILSDIVVGELPSDSNIELEQDIDFQEFIVNEDLNVHKKDSGQIDSEEQLEIEVEDLSIDNSEVSCETNCSPDERKCVSGQEYQYCFEVASDCWQWTEIQECHPDKYCEDGICKLRCDVECLNGSCDDNCEVWQFCDENGICQDKLCESWQTDFITSDADYFSDLTSTTDDGYVAVGFVGPGTTLEHDYFVAKLHNTGEVQWSVVIGDADDLEWAESVKEVFDGGYIVAGYAQQPDSVLFDAWILQLDPDNGSIVWSEKFGGTGNDRVYDIVPTDDGKFVAVGYSTTDSAGGKDFWVLRLSQFGELEGEKKYGGSAEDWGTSIDQVFGPGLVSDGFILSGYTQDIIENIQTAKVLKLDNSGELVWEKSFSGGTKNEVHKVIQSFDGGLVFTGIIQLDPAEQWQGWIFKLSYEGDLLWEQVLGGSEIDLFHSIQQTEDTGYIAVGDTWSMGAGMSDVWLVKLFNDGEVEWQKTFGGTDMENGMAVAQTETLGFVVAGNVYPNNGFADAFVVKLDHNGEVCDE